LVSPAKGKSYLCGTVIQNDAESRRPQFEGGVRH
jgi:hypothetical protein